MREKKLVSLLLAGALTVSLAACGGQEAVTNNQGGSQTETTNPGTAESTRPTEPQGQLIIGSTTQMGNDFYDPKFSNNAVNYKTYDLLHGYATVVNDMEGALVYDPTVVASHDAVENEDGTKTYTVTINDGLTWSDGTPSPPRTMSSSCCWRAPPR